MAKTAGWQLGLAVTTFIDRFAILVQFKIAQPLPGGAHTQALRSRSSGVRQMIPRVCGQIQTG